MHAVVITEPGEPEVLHWLEVPDPVPGPGEVVTDVAASGVNRADLMQRQGLYPPPPGAPPYPGLECAGRIRSVGDGVADWRPGDQLYYVSDLGRVEEKLGWRPRLGLETGLRDLVAWAVEQGATARS